MPLQGLEGNIITRIDSFPTESNPVPWSTTHHYPFKTLPTIKSHLHPKFAIVNAGAKMQELSDKNYDDFARVLRDFPCLRLVMDLLTAWKRSPRFSDTTFDVPFDISEDDGGGGNDNESDYDNQTVHWRDHGRKVGTPQGSCQGSPVRKRKRGNPAPRASGSKRKVLSELSLYKHNQQKGAGLWTDNRIRKWAEKSCSLGQTCSTPKFSRSY